MNYSEKNRMVLRLYWICTVCVIFLQVLYFAYFLITDSFADKLISMPEYIKAFIVIPSAVSLALGLVLTFILHKFCKSSPVTVAGSMLAGMVIFVTMVVCTHYGIAVIFAAFLFPILLSLFYNNRKMTLFTSFFVLVTYILVVLAYLPTRNQTFVRHDDIDMAAMPAFIIMTTVIGMRILDIYSDLIDKIIDQTVKKLALERKSKEDSLTKLYNHAVFYDSLDFAVNSFEDIHTPFCVIVMDLDDFKAINDTYGHGFGDLVLLRFADVVRSKLDENDMAFRYGGEEFSVISFRTLREAVFLAEIIRMAFSKESFDVCPDKSFTVSLGVSEYSKKYRSKREFFASADRALYAAKKRGKNQTVAATEDI